MNSLLNTVKNAAENGYRVFVIRKIREEAGLLNVGDRCPDSYSWDIELDVSTRETTGETINGACAIVIDTNHMFLDGSDDDELEENINKALNASEIYYSDETMLIGGKSGYEYGYDDYEVIIRDADVLAIIE